MKQKIVLGALFILGLSTVNGQVGGKYIYSFLNYSYSARMAGLGGGLISVRDDDPSLIIYNPSTISPRFDNSFSTSVIDYFNSASYGTALYSNTYKKVGSLAFEMRFVGYGEFTRTDEAGNELGTFSAGDYAATVGWGRQLDSCFSIGASMKLIYSGYESYHSFGIAADVAGTYYNDKHLLSLTLLIKNIGTPIKTYTPGVYERVPFDIQFALSQRFKHLPVRYHISLHSLYKWQMRYVGADDPVFPKDVMNNNEPKYPSLFVEGVNNFFRHITFGLEFIPAKSFSLFVSYNHNRNQEMKILQRRTLAGFSYGLALNIKSVQISFARATYSAGIAPNFFTLGLNFNKLAELSQNNKTKKLERVQNKDKL